MLMYRENPPPANLFDVMRKAEAEMVALAKEFDDQRKKDAPVQIEAFVSLKSSPPPQVSAPAVAQAVAAPAAAAAVEVAQPPAPAPAHPVAPPVAAVAAVAVEKKPEIDLLRNAEAEMVALAKENDEERKKYAFMMSSMMGSPVAPAVAAPAPARPVAPPVAAPAVAAVAAVAKKKPAAVSSPAAVSVAAAGQKRKRESFRAALQELTAKRVEKSKRQFEETEAKLDAKIAKVEATWRLMRSISQSVDTAVAMVEKVFNE